MSHNAEDSPGVVLELETALEDLHIRTVEVMLAARSVPTTILNLKRLETTVAEAVSLIRLEVEEALSALAVLATSAPLAAEFPDGKLPPATLSPRQVLYLNDLAVRKPNPR